MTEQKHLFTRLAQSHKPDCMLSLAGPEPAIVPRPEELARTLGSDTVARYAEACRPVYEDLRRIIGQISGLAILARVAGHRNLSDLPELKRCEERALATSERLFALAAPPGAESHKRQLEAAFDFSRRAMRTFSSLVPSASAEEKLGEAEVAIKRAYAHLSAATAPRAGLEMVDFSHACCCGVHADPAPKDGKNGGKHV
ncbi:MAG: hypothetical protein RID23_09405 [Roseovarius sp.]